MEPITRKERILSGEDIKPITRLEHFLKEAAGGGGGSSLPSYTDADNGKVLGLAETDGTVAPAWVNGGGGANAWDFEVHFAWDDELQAYSSSLSVADFAQIYDNLDLETGVFKKCLAFIQGDGDVIKSICAWEVLPDFGTGGIRGYVVSYIEMEDLGRILFTVQASGVEFEYFTLNASWEPQE